MQAFEAVTDTVLMLGIVGGALVGIWYLLSPSFRARKLKTWGQEGGMKAASEWGEWLAMLLFVLVFAAIAVGLFLRERFG